MKFNDTRIGTLSSLFSSLSRHPVVRPLGLLLCAAISLGCGGSDSEIFAARVVDIEAQDANLEVGEGTVIAVEFSYDVDDVDSGGRVVVTVRLPEGLELREGTSEIDTDTGDESVGAQVFSCDFTGESYLVYDLDRFDLSDAINPSGDADSRLTLTIDGTAAVGFAVVQARADSNFPAFDCDAPFLFDAQVGLTIS